MISESHKMTSIPHEFNRMCSVCQHCECHSALVLSVECQGPPSGGIDHRKKETS